MIKRTGVVGFRANSFRWKKSKLKPSNKSQKSLELKMAKFNAKWSSNSSKLRTLSLEDLMKLEIHRLILEITLIIALSLLYIYL